MTWEHTWEPDLSGLSQEELRKLIFEFSPSPNSRQVIDMTPDQIREYIDSQVRLGRFIRGRGNCISLNPDFKQEIGLGDIVSHQWSDGYDNGTVCQVHKDGTVDIFRPYVHSADFSCAGRHEGSLSILTYIGVETCKDVNPERLRLVRKNTTPIR